MMKIAVLAWGSLVWDPRELHAAAPFAPNGPLLPIEFCRVSGDGRLTLVIDEAFGIVCKTYSAPSAIQSLDEAVENLRGRERMSSAEEVGFVESSSGKQSDVAMRRHPEAIATIAAWSTANGFDAAIWTALESNFGEHGKGGEPFSVTAATRYLERLAGQDAAKFDRALDYIRKVPPEVDTPVRDEVTKRWPA
ncbi:MAG: hypothetical protein WB647_11415 [Roseiarcus sp.]|uniref:hypothetical protein n=1 Tax=Roseiarcus sp. TaxID=1969460 RepID=UPI003C3796AB